MPRSRPSPSAKALLLVLPLLALAPAAQALKSDREQPLDIRSDYSKTDQKANVTVLTGNVRFVQGSIKGAGDKATLSQGEDNQIRRVQVEGKPATLVEQLDNNGGTMRSRAANIDFDAETNVAVLTGDAVVVQEGRGEFHSERIVYNTDSGEITGGTEAPGGGVHMIVQPKNKPAAASAAEKKD
jgi:lipopolysaccharide export system protein LptA